MDIGVGTSAGAPGPEDDDGGVHMARWTAGLAPVLSLALLLTALSPGIAAAGGYPEAEKAYSMGRLLVDLGDTTRGLFELKRAASIVPSPRYLEAIVEVYRDLGRDEQALAWGQRYLEMTEPEERDEAVAAWLGQVLERLRSSRVRVSLRVSLFSFRKTIQTPLMMPPPRKRVPPA